MFSCEFNAYERCYFDWSGKKVLFFPRTGTARPEPPSFINGPHPYPWEANTMAEAGSISSPIYSDLPKLPVIASHDDSLCYVDICSWELDQGITLVSRRWPNSLRETPSDYFLGTTYLGWIWMVSMEMKGSSPSFNFLGWSVSQEGYQYSIIHEYEGTTVATLTNLYCEVRPRIKQVCIPSTMASVAMKTLLSLCLSMRLRIFVTAPWRLGTSSLWPQMKSFLLRWTPRYGPPTAVPSFTFREQSAHGIIKIH